MPKRVALTALLPGANEALDSSTEQDAAMPTTPELTQRAAPTEAARTTPARGLTKRAPEPTERQRYSDLVRKEARLRDDQIDALATHARRLARAKAGTEERITDNTLIRIAVDMLLRDAAKLHGSTESELRNSVDL